MPQVTPLGPEGPRRVGRYRLIGRLDGFAVPSAGPADIFLARGVTGDFVVVTVMSESRAGDPATRDRFTAEARAARRVPPFCAARILDAGFEGSRPYLVSEFIPGPSLTDILSHAGPLPPDTVRALAVGCATGLAAIHQAGQVHGHLTPDLVVISPQGPRLVQFSVTPPYGDATPAADMRAWATVVTAGATARVDGEPPSEADLAELPAEVAALARDCLTLDPTERPSAREVLTELLGTGDVTVGMLAEGSRLARAAAQVPLPPEPDGMPAPAPPRRARSRAAAWVLAFCACLVVIGVATLAIARGPAPAPRTTTPPPAALPTKTPAALVPEAFAGRWAGVIRQSSPALTARVNVHLTAGRGTGDVDYPTLHCSGTLAVVSAARTRLVLRQRITIGAGTCHDGFITLESRASGEVMFTFSARAAQAPSGTLSHGLASEIPVIARR